MKILFDDMETTTGDESGFYLDLPCIPRIGEVIRVDKSLLNPRFLTGDYYEYTDTDETVFGKDNNLIWLEIIEVYYDVDSEMQTTITIGFDFIVS